MADTKQATPRKEEKWKSEYRKRIAAMSVFELVDEVKESSAAIGDEFYDSHVAWEADTAVEELKSRLASRSGPKQATPDVCPRCGSEQHNIVWQLCSEDAGMHEWHALAQASRSGPDRTPDTVEYWKSRATTAELKVLTFYEEIAKLRSGPDRTTPDERLACRKPFGTVCRSSLHYSRVDDHCYCGLAKGHSGEHVCVMCGWAEAGLDRGQQDAPGVEVDGIGRFSIMLKKGETLTDIADELAHVAEQAVMPPLETHVEALQITMKFAADKLRQFMAKAAREGQDTTQMLLRIRATLQSRAEGHNTGGDIEVMKAVDAIVAREAPKGKST